MYTYKYPRPAITTDAIVFGYNRNNEKKVDDTKLYILLIERGNKPYKGCWALPGGFVNMNETVEEGVKRELSEETGIEDIEMEQLHVFSKIDRDPRERVISVAFTAIICKSDYHVIGGDDAAKAKWFKITQLPPLAFDHEDIISMAIQKIHESNVYKSQLFTVSE
jgi:8-oxo-dGTP diphosphatase